MEAEKVLKQPRAKQIAGELWIWLKYSMFMAGIASSVMFIRINYLGADLQLNTAEIPLLVVPNAVITDPTPAPRKK